MKNVARMLIFLCIISCKGYQYKHLSEEDLSNKLRGVVLISARMNSSFFFPFDEEKVGWSPSDLLINKYDTGFLVSWKNGDIRNELMDREEYALEKYSVYSTFAFIEVSQYQYDFDYYSKSDSVYSFTLEYEGYFKEFFYFDKSYTLERVNILSTNQPLSPSTRLE